MERYFNESVERTLKNNLRLKLKDQLEGQIERLKGQLEREKEHIRYLQEELTKYHLNARNTQTELDLAVLKLLKVDTELGGK